MNIEIRRLTPELASDYVRFFDRTPHDDNTDENKCYCVCWCSDDYVDQDFSTPEKRRDYAFRYVREGHIQGYLAYCDGEVVGWCNANTKSECLKCTSWLRFMGDVPAEEAAQGIKVKSIYCFVIAPGMQRKGIARLLVERVCEDAAADGFDFVEAYPNKAFIGVAEEFRGPVEMYRKLAFVEWLETGRRLVMRKGLG